MTNNLPNAASQSPNLADARPIAQKAEPPKPPEKPFDEWIKAKCAALEELEVPVWQQLTLVWELINHFINGDQLLRRGHRYPGWIKVPLPNNTASAVRQQNKLGFYSRSLMARWVASRTKVQAVAGDDSDESVGAARAAQAFVDALEPMLYSEDFRQREGLCAQAHGTYARYFFYDADAEDGGYGEKPITEQREFGGGQDEIECSDCGYYGAMGADQGMGGPPQDTLEAIGGGIAPPSGFAGEQGNAGFAPMGEGQAEAFGDAPVGGDVSLAPEVACPQCGSPNIQVTPAVSQPIEVQTGTEKYKLGRIKAMTVPYAELRHEIALSAEESPWLRWKRRVRIEELKQKFPGIQMNGTGNADRDTGLLMERRLERSLPQSARGAGSYDGSKDYGEFSQWWFTPPMYSEYIFPVDVETVAGEIIPAGTAAKDIFPDGMYIARVEGVDAPLQVRNEKHSDHWVTAPYHIRNFTKMGLGINDAVEMQRQWNVVLSLIFEQIRTTALPGYLYDKDAIDNDDVKLLGQPSNNVPVSTRNREPGIRLDQLVHKMEPGTAPAHLFSYIQLLDANMQTIAGALVNQGVPGAEGDTATAAEIFSNASNQHNAPEFALKGDADVRSMELCFKIAQQFYVEPRWLPIKGKHGKQDGLWLSAADLCNGQIRFEAVHESWMPNTKAEKVAAVGKLIMLFGNVQGFLMAAQMKPDFVASMAAQFSLDIEDLIDNNFSAAVIVTRQRIDQILERAPQYAPIAQQALMMQQAAPELMMQPGEVDPMTGMQGPPTMIDPLAMIAEEIIDTLQPEVVLEEPAQNVSRESLQSWLIDDQGKDADKLTRACIQALIRRHYQFETQQAAALAGLQMAATPQSPMPEGGPNEPAKKTVEDKRSDQAEAGRGGQPRPQPRPSAAPPSGP